MYVYIQECLLCLALPLICVQVHETVLSITRSIKRELEKATSEKTEIHRHYIMVQCLCAIPYMYMP